MVATSNAVGCGAVGSLSVTPGALAVRHIIRAVHHDHFRRNRLLFQLQAKLFFDRISQNSRVSRSGADSAPATTSTRNSTGL